MARPAELGDRLAHDALRLAARVRLGVVEEVHAGLVGGVETFHRGVDAELVAERDPRSEGQHADLEAAAAEASIFHGADRTLAGVLLAVVVETSHRGRGDAFAQDEDRGAGDAAARVRAGRDRDGRLPADGRAAPGSDRCRLGDALGRARPGRRRAGRADRDRRRARRARSTASRRRPGPGSAAARQAILGDAVRARRPRPRPTSSCASSPASCARARSRADGRRDRRAPREVPADAVRRAAMLGGDLADDRPPRARRRRGRARRGRPARCCGRCSRCSPRPRPPSPRRSPRPDARRSSGSSTARASRCTAPATRCASSRATSTTSPRACPRSSRSSRAFAARTFVLDGEAIGLADDALPRRFQDTMSRFGRDDATSHAMTLAAVLLRRAAPRRRRPARPAARRTRPRSSPTLVGEWRVPAIETDDRGRRRSVPRRRARDRPRRRDGEGARLALRGRSARRVVAQGQAGAHARSRRARGGVGTRSPARLALEPPPRRARSRAPAGS